MSPDLVKVIQTQSYSFYFVLLFLAAALAQPSQNFNLENLHVPNSNHENGESLARKNFTEQGLPARDASLQLEGSVEHNGESTNNSSVSDNPQEVKVEEILRKIFESEFDDEEVEEEEDFQDDPKLEVKVGDAVPPDQTNKESSPSEDFAKNGTRQARAKRNNRRRKPQNQQSNENSDRKAGNRKYGSDGSKGGGRVAQNNRKRPNRKNSAQNLKPRGKGVDLAKFNAYMDAVLGRMNALIRKKRMDPLRVNLYSGPGPNQRNKNKNGNGNRKRKTSKKSSARLDEDEESSDSQPTTSREEEDDESGEDEDGRSVRDVTLVSSQIFQRRSRALSENSTKPSDEEEVKSGEGEAEAGTGEGRGKNNKRIKGKKNTNESESSSGSSKADAAQQTRKAPAKKNSPRPTRGILHGLSSLRRDGNVQIIKDGTRARIIRSRFFLGPVALEILPKKAKKKGSSNSRDDLDSASPSPAATATAPQLKGIIEIRLSPGKPTRIRKLRVFPPGNLQVNGDKKSGDSPGARGAGYRKVTPMATARLRQAAVQVVKQVDNRMKSKGGQLR